MLKKICCKKFKPKQMTGNYQGLKVFEYGQEMTQSLIVDLSNFGEFA